MNDTLSISAAVRPASTFAPGIFLDIKAIRQREEDWLARTPAGTLMAAAGAAVADVALRLWKTLPADAPVLLLVGPGNNGGDALVAGRILARHGLRVTAAIFDGLTGQPPEAADARGAWHAWQADGHAFIPLTEAARHLQAAMLVIDGLFGIGLSRPLQGALARLVQAVADAGATVLAIDVPSGLDADRGAAVGDGALMHADHTVTMIADKPGLHTGEGLVHAGTVWLAPLHHEPVAAAVTPVEDEGLPPARADEPAPPPSASLDQTALEAARTPADTPPPPALASCSPAPDCGLRLDAGWVARHLPVRRRDAHKGTAGDVLILGGRLGMGGAARLAARGATAAGAGRVWIATEAPHSSPVDPQHPETMQFTWRGDGLLPGQASVLVLGCGLGQDATAHRWLQQAVATGAPLLIDADALGLLAARPDALSAGASPSALILTPHPLEAARLLDSSVAQVQANRIGAARTLAARFGAVVVLKGAGSVVARADGCYAINGSGHPVLGTAGTGDVLAGTIGALLAGLLRQRRPAAEAAWRAACLGTWLHGRAGECLARQAGPAGIPASQFSSQYPLIFRALLRVS